MSVLDMTLKIQWWGSSYTGDLENEEYFFIAITPSSTLTWSGSTWKGPIYESNKWQAKLNCLK